METMMRGSASFYQDSGTRNRIKFKIDDMVGNTGASGEYTVRIGAADLEVPVVSSTHPDAGVDTLMDKRFKLGVCGTKCYEKKEANNMNSRTTILVLSAVLIAAVLSGCVEELSDHGIETVGPTPQLNVTPSATPLSKVTPSPLQILTPEATSVLPLRKEIHQDVDTTPALAWLLEPGISNITAQDIGFEVTMADDVFSLNEIGKPAVPYIIKEFKIPKDSEIESVSVNLSNPIKIHDVVIEPLQPPTIDSVAEEYYWQNYTPPPYTIDNETYASSEPYPGKEYEYVDYVSTDLDTDAIVKFVIVYIYPIQYIPAESKIIAYTNASVSIVYRVPV